MPRAAAATSRREASTASCSAAGADGAEPLHLGPLQHRVDREDLELLAGLLDETIDPDDDHLARVDGLCVLVGRLLDLVLQVAGLDGRNGATLSVDLLEVVSSETLHLVGQPLEVVAAGKRVDGVGDS